MTYESNAQALQALEGKGPVGWVPKPQPESYSDVESLQGFTPLAQGTQSGTPRTNATAQWERGGWQGSRLVQSGDRQAAGSLPSDGEDGDSPAKSGRTGEHTQGDGMQPQVWRFSGARSSQAAFFYWN